MKDTITSAGKGKARRLLKTAMAKKGVTNIQLSSLLKARGFYETTASINNKLSRGSFSAAFLLDALNAIGCTEISMDTEQDEHGSLLKEDVVPYRTSLFGNANGDFGLQGGHKDIATGFGWIEVLNNQGLPRDYPNQVISLFTGAGGLDLGLEMAGFETKACVEISADCRVTLKRNRPNWGIYEQQSGNFAPGDIKGIRASELLQFCKLDVGEVALVVGGAPCQAFSNIGKRQGVTDVENGGDLFSHFVRIVKGVMPHAFIFENVAGITHARHADVIASMRSQFNNLGYGLSGCILNAANYGVPQKRERFIMIGMRGGHIPYMPLPTHSKDKKTWAAFVENLAPVVDYDAQPWATVGQAFKSIPSKLKNRTDYAVMNISPMVKERMRLIKHGENFHVLPMEMRPQCWKTGKHQGADTFGRLRPDQPSVTIRTAAYNPAKGRYIHPFENRGLSTHELAALQGFPSEWQFYSSKYDAVTLVSGGMQIGNAVPPPLGRALGLAVRKQLHLCAKY